MVFLTRNARPHTLGLTRFFLDGLVCLGGLVIAIYIAHGYSQRVSHLVPKPMFSGIWILEWLRLEWVSFIASLEVFRRVFDRSVSIGGVSMKAMVISVLYGLLIQFPIAYALSWAYWKTVLITDWWLLPFFAQLVTAAFLSALYEAFYRYLPDPAEDVPIATAEEIKRSL